MQLQNQQDVKITNIPTRGLITPPPTAACAVCSVDNVVYMFGGRQYLAHDRPFSNDLWCLDMTDPSNAHWDILPTYNTPPPRWGHTLQLYNGHLILFGGSRIGLTYQDLWILDIRHRHTAAGRASGGRQSLVWREVVFAESDRIPAPRGGHSAVVLVRNCLCSWHGVTSFVICMCLSSCLYVCV